MRGCNHHHAVEFAALQQSIGVRGHWTRIHVARVRRHQRHHILQRRRGRFRKEVVEHLPEFLRIGWIERSRNRWLPDLGCLSATAQSAFQHKGTRKRGQRDDTEKQNLHMRGYPSQMPGMACWQNLHLPPSRCIALTVKPARSTTTRRHFVHQVLSAGWPGTLPMYTYWGPSASQMALARSSVGKGVGGRFFNRYSGWKREKCSGTSRPSSALIQRASPRNSSSVSFKVGTTR